MSALGVFMLGMLAGLALAPIPTTIGFFIAKRRARADHGGRSVVYTVRERGADDVRQAFRSIGAEAQNAKADVDRALAGIEALRRETAK